MKKVIFVALAAAALFTSCAKPDKCKCSFKLKSDAIDIALKDQIIERPEDKNCSQIKVEDIEGEVISIDLSKIGSINCVNYKE